LESKQEFDNWIKSRIDKFDFVENQDYVSLHKIMKRENGASTRIEYGLKIEMAKELAMVENNEKEKDETNKTAFREREVTWHKQSQSQVLFRPDL
jgi:anti-repressor protein